MKKKINKGRGRPVGSTGTYKYIGPNGKSISIKEYKKLMHWAAKPEQMENLVSNKKGITIRVTFT